MPDLARYELCEGHFRDWLSHGGTGCRFASSFAVKEPVRLDFYYQLGDVDHEVVAAFIDSTAAREVTAVLLFPELRTARGIAQLLAMLRGGARWKVRRTAWPRGFGKTDSVAFALEWQTAAKTVCDAMGLAPLGTMPVTRRSPYVAIVVWGGAHLNKYVRPGPHVGAASAPTGFASDVHKRLMKVSDERVRELLGIPPAEHPEWLRTVGFILPHAAAELLAPTKRPPKRRRRR